MKISVIIPVYNVQMYLGQCVRSVLNQDHRDLEIILVDDGSTDESGRVCDSFAKADPRVKVIHKSNGGLSDARNVGVGAAGGDYVLFLDGDDLWNDSGAVSALVDRVKETGADVLNFSYAKWYESSGKQIPYFRRIPAMPRMNSIADQLEYLSGNGLYIASACNKLIRRALLPELPFQRGVFSEDVQWCAKLMLQAQSMDFICANFYLYRQHSNSIRHTINDKKCADLTESILACVDLADNAPAQRRKAMLRYAAFQLGTFFLVQAQATNPQPECIRKLEQCSGILVHHGGNGKIRLLYWGCRVLSFPRMCKMIRTIYHRK